MCLHPRWACDPRDAEPRAERTVPPASRAGNRVSSRRSRAAAGPRRPSRSDPRPASVSLWMATENDPGAAAAGAGRRTVDVCVIGAGIAGLSAAYSLVREPASRSSCSTTGRSAGPDGRHDRPPLPRDGRPVRGDPSDARRGRRPARAASHTAAIDRIETIVEREGIACDFERLDGYLFVSPGESPADVLDARARGRARRAGLARVELARREPPALGPRPARVCASRDQAQFHPLKYLAGARRARSSGTAGGSSPTARRDRRGERRDPATVETSDRRTRDGARAVVVATNTPVNDLVVAPHEAGAVPHVRDRRCASRRDRARTASTGTRRIPTTTCACSGCACHGRRGPRRPDRRRRGPQDRPGRRRRRALRALEKWTRERFPIGRARRLPLVRAGDGAGRRPRLHRPQPAGRARTSTSPPATAAWA